ncbi:MAG: HTH domain-containing protein [Patescibacteria group bacterium]|jgi:predicted HTH transcriptional regulator
MQLNYLIAGLVIGLLVGWFFRKPKGKARENVRLSEAEREKAGNIEKINSYISSHSSVTNAEIAKLLGVSDATVVRYMDELEASGAVRQIGKTGIDAHYEKVN